MLLNKFHIIKNSEEIINHTCDDNGIHLVADLWDTMEFNTWDHFLILKEGRG